MPSSAPYYITTPIYYVNDRPHIGHCYTTTVADAAARAVRLIRGEAASTFFLTGTDEHADKVVTSAAANGSTPQAWADKHAATFRAAFTSLNCGFDDFIRTTEPRHKDKVPGYISALLKTGAIYKGTYTGWYDAGQEEYMTETAAREANFKSPINGKPLVQRTEDCYFFRLSAYQERLLAHINANPHFIQPDARRQEVLGRLRQTLNDIPVSRPVTDDPATQWGVRMPGDPANRVYVWIDALFNYYTTVDTPERKHLWPAAVHLIGKDILWFHAVIWPALLMALDFPLPRMIFGHGWWVSEGQKMSKSLGNFIDLERMHAYAGAFSLDGLRWYLLTQGPLSGQDADFSHAKFVEVYNADLANGIGNCASRVSNMIVKYFDGVVPAPGTTAPLPDYDFKALCAAASRDFVASIERFDIAGAFGQASEIIRKVDGYINVTAPFKLAKTVDANPAAKQELAAILYNCAEAVRVASVLMSAAMPQKMAALWAIWNCSPPASATLADLATFGGPHALKPGSTIAKGEALFMRADPAAGIPGTPVSSPTPPL
jgi:methionyl-tRNA synthetase